MINKPPLVQYKSKRYYTTKPPVFAPAAAIALIKTPFLRTELVGIQSWERG